jgi:hypothetical protein
LPWWTAVFFDREDRRVNVVNRLPPFFTAS